MKAIVIAVLLLVAAVPTSGAQDAAPLLEDAAGDTQTYAGPSGVPLAVAGQTDAADLRSLDVVETDDQVELILTVGGKPGEIAVRYTIEFEWSDTMYRADAWWAGGASRNWANAWLQVLVDEDDNDWDYVSDLEISSDDAGVLRMLVPKVYLLDSEDRTPNRGDALSGFVVRASQGIFNIRIMNDAATGSVVDVMPDDEAGVDYVFALGDTASGALRLTTEDRVRVSNGGATTFVFRVTLHNAADASDEVRLVLADLPEGWNGTVQTPIKIDGRDEKSIPILMTVPFEHKHGGFDGFRVEATSSRDAASAASVRLGVLHTPIPQPAGHHAELYLHGERTEAGVFGNVWPWSYGYVNTVSDHANDIAEIPPDYDDDGSVVWWLPLNPGLRMGLDFDTTRTGTLTGKLFGRATGAGELTATVALVKYGERGADLNELAESDTVTLTLDPNAASEFSLTLTPTEASDYVEYDPDQDLVVILELKSDMIRFCCFMNQAEPSLTTGDFLMKLPLNEYHDKLPTTGETGDVFTIVADGPVEKLARPGSVMTYAFDLTNNGPSAFIDLDVAGTDADLGVVVPGRDFELASGATKRITLAIQVPGEAAEGHQLEVLLFAHAQDDPSKMAIVRTITTVTLGSTAGDDETDVLLAARDAERPTPGAPLALLVGALALVALAHRRRA